MKPLVWVTPIDGDPILINISNILGIEKSKRGCFIHFMRGYPTDLGQGYPIDYMEVKEEFMSFSMKLVERV